MNITLGLGLILVVVAVVLLSMAGLLVLLDTTNSKAYLELMAFGGAFGFLGVKLP